MILEICYRQKNLISHTQIIISFIGRIIILSPLSANSVGYILNMEIDSGSIPNVRSKKISIEIELMASLKRPNNISRLSVQKTIPSTTIRELLLQLGYDELIDLPILLTYVNEDRVHINYILKDNDKIFVTIPIGGG